MPPSKVCACCGVEKPLEDFYLSKTHSTGRTPQCKECRKAQATAYRRENPDKYKGTHRRLTDFVIEGYGGKCACCGESHREFLTLDHVAGGGRKSNERMGGHSMHYYDARSRNFPPDYQVLCYNCNYAKRTGAKCPHDTTRQLTA